MPTPEEQLQAIEAEIQRRNEDLNRLGAARDEGQDVNAVARNIGGGYGIQRSQNIGSYEDVTGRLLESQRRYASTGQQGNIIGEVLHAQANQGLPPAEIEKKLAARGIQMTPEIERILYGSSNLSGDELQSRLRSELDPLMRRKARAGEALVDKQLLGAKDKEAQALAGLQGQKEAFMSSVDEQLKQLLEETGIQAGEARAQVGEGVADRGLLRSSFAGEKLGQVTQAELQQKAQQRAQAAQSKIGAERAVEQTQRNIAQRRQGLELNRNLSELKSFQDVGFQLDTQSLQDQFSQQMANMQLKEQEAQSFGNVLGGLFQGIGTIVGGIFGGPPGAALLGGAGAAIGKGLGGGR